MDLMQNVLKYYFKYYNLSYFEKIYHLLYFLLCSLFTLLKSNNNESIYYIIYEKKENFI